MQTKPWLRKMYNVNTSFDCCIVPSIKPHHANLHPHHNIHLHKRYYLVDLYIDCRFPQAALARSRRSTILNFKRPPTLVTLLGPEGGSSPSYSNEYIWYGLRWRANITIQILKDPYLLNRFPCLEIDMLCKKAMNQFWNSVDCWNVDCQIGCRADADEKVRQCRDGQAGVGSSGIIRLPHFSSFKQTIPGQDIHIRKKKFTNISNGCSVDKVFLCLPTVVMRPAPKSLSPT